MKRIRFNGLEVLVRERADLPARKVRDEDLVGDFRTTACHGRYLLACTKGPGCRGHEVMFLRKR